MSFVINEVALKRLFVQRNGDAVAFQTKRRGMPFILVIPKGEDRYMTVRPKENAKQVYKVFNDSRYRNTGNLTPAVIHAWEDGVRHFVIGSAKHDYERRSDIFEVRELNKADLYKFLTLDNRIGPEIFVKYFGDIPEVDSGINVGGAKLQFPDDASKKTIELAKDLIGKLHGYLDPVGLSDIVDGPYRFLKSTSNVVGTYNPKLGIVTVSIPLLRKNQGDRTLIHEMGHKWDDQRDLGNTIEKKFSELREAGERYDVIWPDHLRVGTPVSYDGDRKDLKGSYTISRISMSEQVFYVEHDFLGGYLKVPFAAALQFNYGSEPIKLEPVSKWFPTSYSESKPSEWFAENFVDYVTGDMDPEVREWFDSLPR